jgi:hypothetical protein
MIISLVLEQDNEECVVATSSEHSKKNIIIMLEIFIYKLRRENTLRVT